MKRLLLIFVLISMLTVSIGAQEEEDKVDVLKMEKLWKLDLGFTGVALSYDLPFSSSFLMETSLGVGPAYTVCNGTYEATYDFVDPALHLALAGDWYYNRSQRLAKGKSILHNSGNFVGVTFRQTSRGLIDNNYSPALLTNMHWGMSRKIDDKWLIRLKVGLGYAHDWDWDEGVIYPSIDFKFSYIFPW